MVMMDSKYLRKIFMLSRERGLDNDTLHSLVYSQTGKESLKKLTLQEGFRIIELLAEDKGKPSGMATARQLNYIYGLMKKQGWTDKNGKPDISRLAGFVKERFGLDNLEWLDVKTASDVIEAFKAMEQRKAV